MKFTDEQWRIWNGIALNEGLRRTHFDMALAEDLAASAMEKLLKSDAVVDESKMPAYVRKTVLNLFLDHRDKQKPAALGSQGEAISKGYFNADGAMRLPAELIERSPSYAVIANDVRERQSTFLRAIFDSLSLKERELLDLTMRGYSNHDIAEILGYANNKIVATRLKQIYSKIEKNFDLPYGVLD